MERVMASQATVATRANSQTLIFRQGRPLRCPLSKATAANTQVGFGSSAAENACSRRLPRNIQVHSASSDPQSAPASPHCVIIECDSVLMDVHVDGHRVAFNKSFEELGHTCVNWNAPIYFDLMRLGDSTGPGLIRTYYETRGWPLMLATSDRSAFVKKVYEGKQRIFKEMVASASIPLRDGAIEFIDELLADGVRPIILAGTAASPEDSVVSSAMMNLGPNRAFQLQVITLGSKEEDEEEEQGGGSDGSGDVSASSAVSFEMQVIAAQNAAKNTVASSFAQAINRQNVGVGMRIDPGMFAAQQRAGLASPALFSAITSVMGCPAAGSALISASQTLMESAKAAGLATAGMPPSLAARGGFSAMDYKFDGFGPGNLTWRKLRAMLEARAASAGS